MFPAEKQHILNQNMDYNCMENYGKIKGPSLLTFSTKRAMMCDFFYLLNSCMAVQ